MESPETARRRAALDLVIIGGLADGGLRRSEAAALTWSDVELWPDGTDRLTIQKGKRQPDPATVAVTARALGEIRPGRVDPDAPVFGLTDEALANRVRAAGLPAGDTGSRATAQVAGTPPDALSVVTVNGGTYHLQTVASMTFAPNFGRLTTAHRLVGFNM